MAGSYSHATTRAGNLRSNESFAGMIENVGDLYEMAEEMYGMIWYLAEQVSSHTTEPPKSVVERARQRYEEGLRIAREVNRRGR